MTATATAPAVNGAATTTVLKARLGSDGKFKFELLAREQDKLSKAMQLCQRLAKVPALEAKAQAVTDAISELSKELSAA